MIIQLIDFNTWEIIVFQLTAGAAAPGIEGTYYETDLDTGRSRDLATPKDAATSESQRRDLLAGPKPSAFPSSRGTSVPVKSNFDASIHGNNIESTGKDSSTGRLREVSRQPYDMTGERRENLNSSRDLKLQGSSDEKLFRSDLRVEDLSHSSDHVSKPLAENQSIRQRWPPNQTVTSRDRAGFQSGSEQRSLDEPSERGMVQNRSVRDEFSVGGNVGGGRISDVAAGTKSQPANDSMGYEARQLGRTGLGFNTPSTQPGGFRSDPEPVKSNNILNRLLGSGQQSVTYGQQSTTYSQPLAMGSAHGLSEGPAGGVPGGVNPSKPPRQTEEGREWQKETDRNINYRLRPLHGQASQAETSRRPEEEWQKTPNLRLDFSGSSAENKSTGK